MKIQSLHGNFQRDTVVLPFCTFYLMHQSLKSVVQVGVRALPLLFSAGFVFFVSYFVSFSFQLITRKELEKLHLLHLVLRMSLNIVHLRNGLFEKEITSSGTNGLGVNSFFKWETSAFHGYLH